MRRQLLLLTALGSICAALLLGSFASPAAAAEDDLPPELQEIYDELEDYEIVALATKQAADNDSPDVNPAYVRLVDETPELTALYEQLDESEIEAMAEVRSHANDGSHATEECIAILVEGGEMEDCWEAPSPLLPETNEIIWGAVGFGIVFFFLAKFGFPAMKSAMDARAERIRDDLKSAEDQRNEAETVLAEYRAQLNDARAEAGRILDEARQTGEQLKRDQETALQAELAEQRERALADIEAQKAQATEELRGDLAQLAIGAAEAVVQRNLDAETQTQLVEDYINQVATSRS